MKRFTLLRSTFCLATIALCSLASTTRAQELVVNGGFESGDFSGWTVNDPSFNPPNPTGYTILGNNPALAHSGSWHVSLGASPNPGSLLQTLNTTPGQAYALSFWLASDKSDPAATVDNDFQIFWNGALVQDFANVPALGTTNSYFTLTFSNLVATGSTTDLEFRYVNNDDYFRLDDVSVTAAVPEPSTIALAVFGLGAIAFGARHRRATA